MLFIELNINMIYLSGMLLLAFLTGFFLRRNQLVSLKTKIEQLESERLTNHAEILDLQKEKAIREEKINQSQVPLISMVGTKKEMEQLENL
jgi:hypothetical protein